VELVFEEMRQAMAAAIGGITWNRLQRESSVTYPYTIRVASRRGEVVLQARRDDGTPAGAVFIPFAYVEAAANLLTNAALDPFGKIPEFKYCAVRVSGAQGAPGRGGGSQSS
jgi:formate dehydrogenase major subunit